MPDRILHAVLAGAFFLLAFILLFTFRTYDDNSLFSWAWLFERADGSRTYLLLIAALIGAFFLARLPWSERHDAPLLAVMSFSAVLPLWCEPELIVDASRYFAQAKHLELFGVRSFFREWGKGIFAWTDLPLVPFCYGILFKLFGESRTVIQAFTSLLFSFAVVLTSRIGRVLWDRETGLSAGLLLLGIPYLLAQVPLTLVDVPTMFLLVLSLAAFLEALERGGRARSALAVVSIVLFLFSKYSAWPLLSVHVIALGVFTFTRDPADGRARFRRGAVLLAAAGIAACIPLALLYDTVSAQLHLLAEYQKPGLERWREGHVSTFLFQVHPFITLAAVASLAMAVQKRDGTYVIIAWPVLLAPVLGIQRIRYILPVFPLLALMAAYGLRMLGREDIRRFVLWGIVTTSIALVLTVYLPFAATVSAANLKRAGERLDALAGREVQVIAVPSGRTVVGPVVSIVLLDLYSRKELRVLTDLAERRPPEQELARSSLRFSWEFALPSFYAADAEMRNALPVIALLGRDDLPQAITDRLRGRRLTASFRSDDGIFRYAPQVLLFDPPSAIR